ncbi:hypothetical protein SKAU_G00240170 [Synaphobranchus kaupii]|uniref:Uncharacterized protein n=1 Tax=Synaphobranchus kaupii TaxID=118154 RepID=A0A9Q1IUA0_SYNKA|nr:hypothetical protein SKAU_G00240170 [Synaphobranchus kaupii]
MSATGIDHSSALGSIIGVSMSSAKSHCIRVPKSSICCFRGLKMHPALPERALKPPCHAPETAVGALRRPRITRPINPARAKHQPSDSGSDWG